MTAVFATLARLLATDPVAALVTVVGVKGSAPRDAGARMVVSAAGAIAGTIGGGRLEMEAIAIACAGCADGRDATRLAAFALGPALGQCCGGHVTVLVETVTAARLEEIAGLARAEAAGGLVTEATVSGAAPLLRRIVGRSEDGEATAALAGGTLAETFARAPRPLFLYGAGHVGRALVLALAALPFAVTWVDERAEMFPAAVPGTARLVAAPRPAETVAAAPAGAFVLVMTHDHDLDLAIVHAALARGDLAGVGLIGSATKRARFERRLQDLGLDEATARSFRCPIGVAGIRSKEPAVIAAAVAADLLIADEAARAALRPPREPLVGAVGRGGRRA